MKNLVQIWHRASGVWRNFEVSITRWGHTNGHCPNSLTCIVQIGTLELNFIHIDKHLCKFANFGRCATTAARSIWDHHQHLWSARRDYPDSGCCKGSRAKSPDCCTAGTQPGTEPASGKVTSHPGTEPPFFILIRIVNVIEESHLIMFLLVKENMREGRF